MLEAFVGGTRGRPSMMLWFLTSSGALIYGGPSHPSRWAEDVNAMLDQMNEEEGEESLSRAWHRTDPSQHDEDAPGYVTLGDAVVYPPGGGELRVSALRLDLEHVSAWWVREPTFLRPEPPGGAG